MIQIKGTVISFLHARSFVVNGICITRCHIKRIFYWFPACVFLDTVAFSLFHWICSKINCWQPERFDATVFLDWTTSSHEFLSSRPSKIFCNISFCYDNNEALLTWTASNDWGEFWALPVIAPFSQCTSDF